MLYNVVSFCCESESCSVVSDSLQPHRLYSPWNSPGQNTGVGSFSLLQGIFPTQGLNPGLPHCRRILYQLSRRGSPSFCCTMKLTSYMHTCITSLPPLSPTPRSSQSAELSSWSRAVASHSPSVLHMLMCIVDPHFPICPALASTCLFSASMSLLLLCTWVHLYQFSRFHMHVLIHNIFSVSDLLHFL